jgi:hypothetical protein
MAVTGEKYTEAHRAVLQPPTHDSLIDAALKPGRTTAVVAGGGLTNLALLMPRLVRLHQAGHPLFVVPLEPQFRPRELPGLFDFVTATGLATTADIEAMIRADERDRLVALLERVSENLTWIDVPQPCTRWREQLATASSRTGRAAVIFAQDVQADPPLSGARGPSGRGDLAAGRPVPAQAATLTRLARETGAIITFGHCMPFNYEEGWRHLTEIADHTIAIEIDELDLGQLDRPRAATLHHHEDGHEIARVAATIDHRFRDWTRAYL